MIKSSKKTHRTKYNLKILINKNKNKQYNKINKL